MKKSSMNIPNMLSILRVLLVPAFAVSIIFMRDIAVWVLCVTVSEVENVIIHTADICYESATAIPDFAPRSLRVSGIAATIRELLPDLAPLTVNYSVRVPCTTV